MDWSELPKELLTTIFSFLSCSDVTSVVCVNSTWNAFTSYNNIWKEAILNDGIPHNYSSSQKDVPWRQFATKYLETKRNIIKKRCVQYALGTRCATSKTNVSIVLHTRTTNGKHCILSWERLAETGYDTQDYTHMNTEVWDLETRTIISNSSRQNLALSNDRVFEIKDIVPRKQSTETIYSPFDPYNPDAGPYETLKVSNLEDCCVPSHTFNSDPNCTTFVFSWSNWATSIISLHVFDLSTGKQIMKKELDDTNYLKVADFRGSKLLLRYNNDGAGHLLVLDVLTDELITIEVESLSAVIAGENIWIATETGLVKYDLLTKEQTSYTISPEYDQNVSSMHIMDGIIWMIGSLPVLTLIDVASCKILTKIAFSGSVFTMLEVSQLSTGAYACLSASYANILSFKNEDIEVPIQVLQIETNGDSQIIDIKQGDLNETIAKYYPHSVTSQIVFEDENQRYYVIHSYSNDPTETSIVNTFIETAKQWMSKVEYHKTAIFQLVHFYFEYSHYRTGYPETMNPTAYGTAWVVYETKINGAWKRAIPLDYWKFFKTKLGLKQ